MFLERRHPWYESVNLRKASTVTRAAAGFDRGFWAAADGAVLFGAPIIAFEAANAQRGEMLPTIMGRTAGLATFASISAVAGAAVQIAFPGLGTFGVMLASSLLAAGSDALIEDTLIRGIRGLKNLSQRRIEMGGRFEDTESGRAARLAALQSMNSTMQASRRYLGQEALFLHR